MNGQLGMKRSSGAMLGLPNGHAAPANDYSSKRARKVVSDVSPSILLSTACVAACMSCCHGKLFVHSIALLPVT